MPYNEPVVNANAQEIKELLKSARTIAVVGLSPNPSRPSYGVAKYMKDRGYKIIPVRPACSEILGEKCYSSLEDIPVPVDIVDVFRQSDHVPAIVDCAIAAKAKALWLQEGIIHNEAARRAEQAGLIVIQDRCFLKEHIAYQKY